MEDCPLDSGPNAHLQSPSPVASMETSADFGASAAFRSQSIEGDEEEQFCCAAKDGVVDPRHTTSNADVSLSVSVAVTPYELEETPTERNVENGTAIGSATASVTGRSSLDKAGQLHRSNRSPGIASSATKHVPPRGQSNSAGSATSRAYHRSSSSAAMMGRKGATNFSTSDGGISPTNTTNASHSTATTLKGTASSLKRRSSIGVTTICTDPPATPSTGSSSTSRTLSQGTSSKSNSSVVDSRRASLSSLSTRLPASSSQMQKWSASPSKAACSKGSILGRPTSLSLQSPRASSKTVSSETSMRNSLSSLNCPAGTVKKPAKSAISSPRTPSSSTKASFTTHKSASFSSLSASTSKYSSSNGDAGVGANRKKPSSIDAASSRRLSSNSQSSRSILCKQTTSTSTPEGWSGSSAKRPSSPLSVDKVSSGLIRRKSSTSESRDSRFIALPQVDAKAGDDVRLDLRGQKVRSLDCNLANLTPKLEFVYLRDNKLSCLTGIEILRRVKVLDLSFNEFKGAGFEPLVNCKSLQQLYLAGNQITSLSSLPQLLNLEFLSVAQNKLKSLAMASQPRLQVLAASKNKISTLKGFPNLPVLEHLRLEENPILDMSHVEAASILLVGPTLKKFNDRDLPLEEQELACQCPAHTAWCIRDGWNFCNVPDATESTMQFLLSQWSGMLPSGYRVKMAELDIPFEGEPCHCHFLFEKENTAVDLPALTLRYQWYIGGKMPINFVPIDGAVDEVYWPKHEEIGCCLKVDCIPILGEIEYPPIFAISLAVTPGTGCPKVLKITVEGEYVEGSVIQGHADIAWCGGIPGKGIVSWLRRSENSSPVAIFGAEDHEYQLTLDDVGAQILLMYTPVTEEGVKGEAQLATTPIIKAALPHVSSVHVAGDPVEGNKIIGAGKYFGGNEGQSKFEWLRQDLDSGEFKFVSRGMTEYLLTEEDVGLRIMFIYTPVNSDGIQGDPVSAITNKVLLAPPKVTQLRIIGDIIEGNKVAIDATVSGGLEGASRVQWFKTHYHDADSSFEDANLEAISTSKIAKAFCIPLEAVGYYLAAKYTPVRSDGECGDAAIIFSDTPVEMLPPGLNFLSITGEFLEGETLTASYGYIGGHEGSSQYSWYLHENETNPGVPIPEAQGLLQYHIPKQAVNKLVSFQCTPARDDGIIGEGRTTMGQDRVRPGSPKLISLQLLGSAIEGCEIQVDKKYWGGDEGPSKLQWFLTRPDGTQREIKGATSLTYTICSEDIASLLCVSCEPIRIDGAKGPAAVSQLIGPVLPAPPTCDLLQLCGRYVEGGCLSFKAVYRGGEKGACIYEWIRITPNGKECHLSNREFLNLVSEDVGCRIELIFTPVRKDGLCGTPQRVISDIVKDAEPVGRNLVIPECCEDVEIVPEKSYFGGCEGSGGYTWFRLKNRLEKPVLPEYAQVLTDSMTYIPTLEDVGTYLALRWVPTRKDGKKGEPLIACCSYPVAPAPPVVHKVAVQEVSPGVFMGEGQYYGGLEGKSKYNWYTESADGVVSLITGATSKIYQVTDNEYACRLVFGYTPAREDGVVGEPVLSEPSSIIFPDLPRAEKLILNGKAIEGEMLTALEVLPTSDEHLRVWEKFKRDVKYQWLRSSVPGVTDCFEPLALQRSCSYKVQSKDIGFCVRCECIVTDIFGRSAAPSSVTTAPIAPGIPKMEKLEIEGRGYHTNLYAVRGIYSGGREGKSTIQWFRAMAGSPDLIPIPGEVSRMYEAIVDDVGYRLVAVYTPIREDGLEGTPVSTSTEPIAVDPEVAKEVKQKLEFGAVKFEVLRDRDRSPMKSQQQQGLGSLERRVLDVNRKRVKVVKPGSKTSFPNTEIRGTYSPPFHVEVFRNDQHRLKIVIDSENEVDLMVQTRHARDVVVLVIRGLAQRFNSTPLNLLLKM
eukprot:c29337_g1_i1 orf=404-6085(-)